MLEQFVLGAIQGIAEWLPVSSEGLIVLTRANFFGGAITLTETIREALFLHLGTFFAALVYFRKDVAKLCIALVQSRNTKNESRRLLVFLFIATAVTGVLGIAIVKGGDAAVGDAIGRYAVLINAAVGILLLGTGFLLLYAKRNTALRKSAGELTGGDAMTLGVTQALAAVPGLSRSGLTVAALLLRGVREEDALRVSFLMSLPVVFLANIVLNAEVLVSVSAPQIVGLLTSFGFGLLTIHGLLLFARRVNFGKFVIGFGVLLLVAAGAAYAMGQAGVGA